MTQQTDQVHTNEIREWHDAHYRTSNPETHRGRWRQFINMQDPYNTDNFLTGWIQMTGGDEYDTLLISEVNDRPAPQRLAGTPKTAYPYRRDRAWLLNHAEQILSSDKYDGSNICQYSYQDADGNHFTSFKMRIRPFVPAYFQVMLNQTLRRYPKVAALRMEPGENMIYELYGRQNPMLIEYDVDIELIAICRRRPDNNDMEPATAGNPAFDRLDCHVAYATEATGWRQNIQAEYVRRQTVHSQGLREQERDGERTFTGQEGEMFYVQFADGDRQTAGPFTRLIKLKPPEIEEIHQASDFVPRAEIEATARNVWEMADDPEVDDLISMLAEDWTQQQISKSTETIQTVLAQAKEKRAFEDGVLADYRQAFPPGAIRQDKKTVMNHMSTIYPRQIMQKVYSALNLRLPL